MPSYWGLGVRDAGCPIGAHSEGLEVAGHRACRALSGSSPAVIVATQNSLNLNMLGPLAGQTFCRHGGSACAAATCGCSPAALPSLAAADPKSPGCFRVVKPVKTVLGQNLAGFFGRQQRQQAPSRPPLETRSPKGSRHTRQQSSPHWATMAHAITLAAHSGTFVLNHAARQRSAPSRALPSSSTQLRGAGQQRLLRQAASAPQGARQGPPGRRGLVLALFEKFTERSIKGVMLAQEEARRLQSAEVGWAPAAPSHSF